MSISTDHSLARTVDDGEKASGNGLEESVCSSPAPVQRRRVGSYRQARGNPFDRSHIVKPVVPVASTERSPPNSPARMYLPLDSPSNMCQMGDEVFFGIGRDGQVVSANLEVVPGLPGPPTGPGGVETLRLREREQLASYEEASPDQCIHIVAEEKTCDHREKLLENLPSMVLESAKVDADHVEAEGQRLERAYWGGA